MQSVHDLINKIQANTVQAIEIDPEVVFVKEEIPELNGKYNALRSATLMPNNHDVLMMDYTGKSQKDFIRFNLLTRAITTVSVNLPNTGYILKFAPLKDPDLIALGGDKGQLYICNLRTSTIECNLQIAPPDAVHPALVIHTNEDKLYGITSETHKNPTFFYGPADATFAAHCIKTSMQSTPGGDVAVTNQGVVYFTGAKYLPSLPSRNIVTIGSNRLNEPSDLSLLLIEHENKLRSLIYHWDDHRNSISYYKEGPSDYIHNTFRLHGEDICKTVILSKKNNLLLLGAAENKYPGFPNYQTKKTGYIYDLDNEKIIGKTHNFMHHPAYLTSISEGVFFDLGNSPNGAYAVSLITASQIKEENELSALLNALVDNTTVKELTLNEKVIVDNESIEILNKLSIKNNFTLTLCKKNRARLEEYKAQQARNTSASAEIKSLHEAYTELQTTNSVLSATHSQYIESTLAEIVSLNTVKNALQERLEAQTLQTATLEQKITALEQDLSAKEGSYSGRIPGLEEKHQCDVRAEEEASANYVRLYEQLAVSSLPSESRWTTIHASMELNEQLSEEFLDQKHSIDGPSLIQGSDNPELMQIATNLTQKGAAFHVSDLINEINNIDNIQPANNQQSKIKALKKTVKGLKQDYKNHRLPSTEVTFLIHLISPEIQKDIELLPWLQELYLSKAEQIKYSIVDRFFTSKVLLADINAVETEFRKAITNLLTNQAHYHERLNDKNLLSKFRSEENSNDPLLRRIISTINISNITLLPHQETEALQAILQQPTEDLNELISTKIFQLFKQLKEKLDPKSMIIQQLEQTVTLLKQKLELKPNVSSVPATLFHFASSESASIDLDGMKPTMENKPD